MKESELKILKLLPSFESEDEEREFWATHGSTEYLDWSRARRAKFFVDRSEPGKRGNGTIRSQARSKDL